MQLPVDVFVKNVIESKEPFVGHFCSNFWTCMKGSITYYMSVYLQCVLSQCKYAN